MGKNRQNKEFFERFVNIREVLKMTLCYTKSEFIDSQ